MALAHQIRMDGVLPRLAPVYRPLAALGMTESVLGSNLGESASVCGTGGWGGGLPVGGVVAGMVGVGVDSL